MQPEQFILFAHIENRHWWFVARRAIIQAVVEELLPPSRDRTIVDIGCGTGGILAALAEKYRCIGIDESEDALNMARRHHPEVRFLNTTDPEALAAERSADLLLFLDVLEHVEDDRALLREIIERMKPGARLVIAVPADMSLWSPHDVAVGHFRRYDRESLSTVWNGLPVHIRFLSPFNTILYPLIKCTRILCQWRRKPWGEAETDFSIPVAPLNALFTWIFLREKKRIISLMRGKGRPPKHGVSLLAVLERVEDCS